MTPQELATRALEILDRENVTAHRGGYFGTAELTRGTQTKFSEMLEDGGQVSVDPLGLAVLAVVTFGDVDAYVRSVSGQSSAIVDYILDDAPLPDDDIARMDMYYEQVVPGGAEEVAELMPDLYFDDVDDEGMIRGMWRYVQEHGRFIAKQ